MVNQHRQTKNTEQRKIYLLSCNLQIYHTIDFGNCDNHINFKLIFEGFKQFAV